MITVSNDFKTQMKAVSKQLLAYVTDGTDEITELDDLKKLKIYTESSLLKTVLRKVEIEHFGTHAYLGEEVNVGLGVDISGTPEYIDYGTFKIYKSEDVKESESVKLTGYDKMYESLVAWDLDPIYDLTYPTTLLGLLQAICTRFGWTLATTTFPNSTHEVASDVFTGVVRTYREVLDYIAEASGSIIYFDVNDELTVAQINKTTSLETLTSTGTGVLNTLTVEPKWGEINSVVLSRMPQEDNIVDKDDDSITANGETQVKIVNNWIVDSDRETWITSIFSTLFELEMYPFKATTNGLGYFQIGDRITVQDLASNNYETVILGIELEMTGALKETLWAETPDKASTDYNTAGILGQKITNTEIIVDKVEGEITSVVEEVDGIQTQLTSITQTVNDIQLQAELTIGENLLLNSVGLKGNVREWQVFDENGDLVDVRNDGTILQTTDIQNNTESRSAIQIEDQFIQQTIVLNPGQSYTFYCKFKKNGTATLDVTGYAQQTITVDDYVDNTWGVYSFRFVAVVANTVIKIETATSNQIIVSDNIVKLGTATGWTQAPNEVYGTNYTFDREGLKIRSLSGSFSSTLDSNSLSIRNEVLDKLLTQITQDQAIINNLIAQDALTIQDSVSPVHPARFIPTPNGLMLVLNK